MKKQFVMIPGYGNNDIVYVTKYVNGIWEDTIGILSDQADCVKKELEAEGWIYSVDVNYLQDKMKEHQKEISKICQIISQAMETGNYILQ